MNSSWEPTVEPGLGFAVWDTDISATDRPADDLKPLRYKDKALEHGHDQVGSVFLCRGRDDWPRVGVASFHPKAFGSLGSVWWYEAIEFTIRAFEGQPYLWQSNAGLPVLLHVNGQEISARAINAQHSQLVISSVVDVAVAVIYADGLAQPPVIPAAWQQWHHVASTT